MLVAQSCPTLFDPMDYSSPGSSVHEIVQARILEWVAMPSSRGSSQPREWTQVSHIAGRFFIVWDTRETQMRLYFKHKAQLILLCKGPLSLQIPRGKYMSQDSRSCSFSIMLSCDSAGKESTPNAGDLGLIPGLGRSPGEGKGYPLQYSGLENSMNSITHGIAKSRTWLSNFHFQVLAIINFTSYDSHKIPMKKAPSVIPLYG